jgi:hydroxymethylpyrimidine/phosphomethylpyrimidine kinase
LPHLREHAPPVLLTVAGYDPSSGAGITADLATFAVHGCFGVSAITALTVQSTRGVAEIQPVDPGLLQRTLAHLTQDIPPAGVKVGMLGSAAIVAVVADFLASTLVPPAVPRVLDPVLRSSSGAALLSPDALQAVQNLLLPAVEWITPNWAELAALTGVPAISSVEQAQEAAVTLGQRHPYLHIVATGGDHTQPIDLLRLPSGQFYPFAGEHIASPSTHGTGCAFSSALLARLVLGDSPVSAVAAAKSFVAEAIRRAPQIGKGTGPLNLLWPLQSPASR